MRHSYHSRNLKIYLVLLFVLTFAGFPAIAQQTPMIEDTTQNARIGRVKDDKLIGRAVLEAATFAPGPTSGQYIGKGPINGQQVPFVDKQPVQGFSAVLDNEDGTFLAMSDNGFGGIGNSADYHLRVYTIRPDFETKKKKKGDGSIAVVGFFELQDPDHHIPFAITNHFSDKRILTGADFDIESFQKAEDGTFWFGDEFGPFLLHTDKEGTLLEAPITLPDFDNPGQEIRAPQNPYNEEISALRIMNAVRAHAQINGNTKSPVFSPWFVMLADNNPATFVPDRTNPPAELQAASSEIFDVQLLQSAGFPVVPYTVNDQESMQALIALGVSGIISDNPNLLYEVASTYDGDSDGQPDFLDEDGLLVIERFDAQGHRGGRNLRPENTLPAMEAGMDYLMTTLETDAGITQDGIPVLDHDPHIESAKVRRADGTPYAFADEVLIKDLTLKEIQSAFIADKLLPGRPDQTNDRSLSPVSVAFAQAKGLMDPYVMPSVQQLFDFVAFYVEYYQSGAGSSHPEAEKRWKNAQRIHFNIETKINPRQDTDARGDVFAARTVEPEPFATALADVIVANNLQDRANIQSFDFRTLLIVQEQYPDIQTVYLFGDFPKVGDVSDGTNLQDENGENTPWLAGLYWPYRSTALNNPFRAQGSGGFEGMALDPWHHRLLPLLEKPLVGGEPNTLLIHEFDLAQKKYTGTRYQYILNERGTAIGDFIMFSPERGLIIERDGSQGMLDGFKRVYEVEITQAGQPLNKRVAVDLLAINDPKEISEPGLPGDMGIGKNFAFPFVTIESVVVFDEKEIGILNDNNYPFSIGRHVGAGLPDDNEFIIIQLGQPLGVLPVLEEAKFTLINADTDQDIQTLMDGDALQTSTLPTQNLSIRVAFPDQKIGSVVFDFNDKKRFQVENFTPYALLGDKEGDYHGFTPPPGIHTITATPYSLADGKGVAGKPARITLKVDYMGIASFTLVDAGEDKDLQMLRDGDVINLDVLENETFNIRANTSPEAVGSVQVEVYQEGQGLIRKSTESILPYALFGDREGNYHAWQPAAGQYTLKATPYGEPNGKGKDGTTMEISFTVVHSMMNAARTTVQSKTKTAGLPESLPASFLMYPNPSAGMVQVAYTGQPGEDLTLYIFDASGHLIKSIAGTGRLDEKIDLTLQSKGWYIAQLTHGQGKITQKFIIR